MPATPSIRARRVAATVLRQGFARFPEARFFPLVGARTGLPEDSVHKRDRARFALECAYMRSTGASTGAKTRVPGLAGVQGSFHTGRSSQKTLCSTQK